MSINHLIAEGKTKKLYTMVGQAGRIMVESKDDITAGDGAKHDLLPGKANWSNQTTCNVFRLLQSCGIPVAFVEQHSKSAFIGVQCEMLPYEVVIRRVAKGSYVRRNPHVPDGQVFPKLVCEFYLKTSGKNWKGRPLTKDDPLIKYTPGGMMNLYHPDELTVTAEPMLELNAEKEVFSCEEEWHFFKMMDDTARKVFLILEKAWALEGRVLCDFKVEFGISPDGKLLLADVIDSDSWRVLNSEGKHEDKQIYRDGGKLSEVQTKYEQTAELTGRFRIPRQKIILWCGSKDDDVAEFYRELAKIGNTWEYLMEHVVCSAHKEPVKAVALLQELVQKFPDSVVIAYIGMSNGAGPTLSAQTTVPVITVPANFDKFPEDVYSSLRGPSNVPVLTVVKPANAVLAALNILSARNPAIYVRLRASIEERTQNVIPL